MPISWDQLQKLDFFFFFMSAWSHRIKVVENYQDKMLRRPSKVSLSLGAAFSPGICWLKSEHQRKGVSLSIASWAYRDGSIGPGELSQSVSRPQRSLPQSKDEFELGLKLSLKSYESRKLDLEDSRLVVLQGTW